MSTTTDQTAHRDAPAESNRDRVRRLLIRPLQEAGMRFPKRTADDDARRALDWLCDDLAYASDRTLMGLREWAESNGQGSARDFWPSVVSFIEPAGVHRQHDVANIKNV